jgi:hypothetical protein
MLKGVRKGSDSKDVNLNDGSGDAGTAGAQPPAPSHGEKSTAEAGPAWTKGEPKPKTSQSDTAHGSFFLRMGTLGRDHSLTE